MKISKSFLKCAEFIERQMVLTLDVCRPLTRKAANPVAEARRLIARAVRLIERSRPTKDGAAAVGRVLREVCRPYFGSDVAAVAAAI